MRRLLFVVMVVAIMVFANARVVPFGTAVFTGLDGQPVSYNVSLLEDSPRPMPYKHRKLYNVAALALSVVALHAIRELRMQSELDIQAVSELQSAWNVLQAKLAV